MATTTSFTKEQLDEYHHALVQRGVRLDTCRFCSERVSLSEQPAFLLMAVTAPGPASVTIDPNHRLLVFDCDGCGHVDLFRVPLAS